MLIRETNDAVSAVTSVQVSIKMGIPFASLANVNFLRLI